jgi:hypothetical protein
MSDSENIERILETIEANETREINEKARDQFETEQAEREKSTLDALLSKTCLETINRIHELNNTHRFARTPILALILNRKDVLRRYANNPVNYSYNRLYEDPQVESTKNYERSIGLTFARVDGNQEEIERIRRDMDENPGLPEFLHSKAMPSYSFSLEADKTEFIDGRQFSSGWTIRTIHCDEINKGNPFGQRLLEGPFYDIDIFRTTTEAEDNLEESTRKFHLRINQSDNSIRKFVAFDESGEPKHEFSVVGAQDKEFVVGLLQQASQELDDELAFFKR